MIGKGRRFFGGVYELGLHVVWCPKYRRRVLPVNARNTSRTCPDCGHVAAENRISQAHFACQRCGHSANADVVGAVNALSRAGLVLRSAA